MISSEEVKRGRSGSTRATSVRHQYEAERLLFASLSYEPEGRHGHRRRRRDLEAAVRVVAPDGTTTLITFHSEGSGARG